MAVLIVTNSAKRVRPFSKLAKYFEFRGGKRVAPYFDKRRTIFTHPEGVSSKTSKEDQVTQNWIKRSRIYSAQLAALQIEEIRISPEEDAFLLLDLIALAKALPPAKDIIVADLATKDGKVAYAVSPLTTLEDSKRIFNNAGKEARRKIFSQISSQERVKYTLDLGIYPKDDVIDLLRKEEKEECAKKAVEKLKATSEKSGYNYVYLLHLLGKDHEPKIVNIVYDFRVRQQEYITKNPPPDQ